MFKGLCNGLLRYILYTCPNLWCNSCSKWYAMDRFGTYSTHAQTCDVTRVQSVTQWTASETYSTHAQTCDVTRVQSATQWTASLHTCPNLWCNSCSKCYATDCFGTYTLRMPQTCDVTRVQSATQWTASVHTLHMPQTLWCNSCSKCYAMDCFGTYSTHALRNKGAGNTSRWLTTNNLSYRFPILDISATASYGI